MAAASRPPPPNETRNARSRRAHRKSRSGCDNCKLRRVKCDEGFPECSRCLSFGVYCNYDIRVPDLQPRYSTSRTLNIRSPSSSAIVADHTSIEETRTELTDRDLGRLKIFQIRTAISLGPPELKQLYQDELCRLMFRHPFLIHICQTLTFIHDRYLSITPYRRTVQEIGHWNKGLVLLNKKLSGPLHPADRDAVWAAASMLGAISFASIEASIPQQAWPLAPSLASPEWLKMGHGKSALWRLTRPDRQDSIFCVLLSAIPAVGSSLENVPSAFIEFYNLQGLSAGSSPYATPLAGVFSPNNAKSPSSTIGLFYAFHSWMLSGFGSLVLAKDPRALIIMAHWYAKMCSGQWWLRKRALIEGQATCLYLQRHFPSHQVIQNLLKAPRECLLASNLEDVEIGGTQTPKKTVQKPS